MLVEKINAIGAYARNLDDYNGEVEEDSKLMEVCGREGWGVDQDRLADAFEAFGLGRGASVLAARGW